MIKLQTKVPVQQSNFRIDHSQKLMSIGSCFAENISHFLSQRKFNIVTNPFGILYNPLSIGKGLEMIVQHKIFKEEDLFFHNELWQSFNYHGDFSGMKKEEVLQHMNASMVKAHQQLGNANILIITLGTAFTYFKKSDGQPVANCHKIPATEFEKRLITVQEIVDALHSPLQVIQQNNPTLQVIFTVSPIRHIRDGIIKNQQSKSTLILAIHQLISQLSNTSYFPSYEIVLDELRDYRFYKKDMVHLTDLALEYIWQRFVVTFFNQKTIELNRKIEKLKAAFSHRPFHPNSEQHQRFLHKQYQIVTQLQRDFPTLNFDEEVHYFGKK